MAQGTVFRFPTFIKASTPERLSEAMLKNNIKHGIEFRYFDIQFVKGKWFAWFNYDHRREQNINLTRQTRGVDD